MSNKCNGNLVNDRVRRRRAQRGRTAEAIRANVRGMGARFGIDRLGFMTLTFADRILDATLAQQRLRSFRTGVLARRYGGFLWVMERTKSGAIHFHLLVPTRAPIRPVGRATRELRRLSRRAAAALRDEQAFLRDVVTRYGFGRVEFRPIRTTIDAVASYLAKGFEDADPTRPAASKGVRLYGVSQTLSIANTHFSWIGDGATQWRRKLSAHVNDLIARGVLPPGSGIDALRLVHGRAWALILRRQLLAAPDIAPPVNGSPSPPEDAPPNAFSSAPAMGRRDPQHVPGVTSMLTMPAATVHSTTMTTGDPIVVRRAIKPLHALCAAFPPMSDREMQELVDDIQANGLREPVVLLDGQVLDGRHRYHACLEAGVEARFREFGSERGDGDDPGKFVMSMNAKRRHLTPGQLAIAAAQVQNWSLAQKRGGDRKSDQSATLPNDSAADRAASVGVSVRTQTDADLVVREAPELAEEVKAGKVSLNRAAKKVRAAKSPVGGEQQGIPTAEDYDSLPSSGDPGEDFDEESLEAPPPKAKPAKPAPPADPRDARIADLLEANEALRDALAMSEQEVATLRAAGTVEGAEKAIRDRDALIDGLQSQNGEWMTKCNELIKQVKALQKVIKRLEAGK